MNAVPLHESMIMSVTIAHTGSVSQGNDGSPKRDEQIVDRPDTRVEHGAAHDERGGHRADHQRYQEENAKEGASDGRSC